MTPGTCVLLGLSLIVVTGCAGVDRAPAHAGSGPNQPETAIGTPQSHAGQEGTTVEGRRAEASGSAVAVAPASAPAPTAGPAPAAPAPAPTAAPVPAAPAPAPTAAP